MCCCALPTNRPANPLVPSQSAETPRVLAPTPLHPKTHPGLRHWGPNQNRDEGATLHGCLPLGHWCASCSLWIALNTPVSAPPLPLSEYCFKRTPQSNDPKGTHNAPPFSMLLKSSKNKMKGKNGGPRNALALTPLVSPYPLAFYSCPFALSHNPSP